MASSNLSKAFICVVGFVLLIGFQNCSKTNFNSDTGALNEKALGEEVFPPGDVVADMPEDVVDEEDIEKDEEDERNGVTCIGNGIKVPDATVVACADGKPKCVQLCANEEAIVASFKQARSLIPAGALPGICP